MLSPRNWPLFSSLGIPYVRSPSLSLVALSPLSIYIFPKPDTSLAVLALFECKFDARKSTGVMEQPVSTFIQFVALPFSISICSTSSHYESRYQLIVFWPENNQWTNPCLPHFRPVNHFLFNNCRSDHDLSAFPASQKFIRDEYAGWRQLNAGTHDVFVLLSVFTSDPISICR